MSQHDKEKRVDGVSYVMPVSESLYAPVKSDRSRIKLFMGVSIKIKHFLFGNRRQLEQKSRQFILAPLLGNEITVVLCPLEQLSAGIRCRNVIEAKIRVKLDTVIKRVLHRLERVAHVAED